MKHLRKLLIGSIIIIAIAVIGVITTYAEGTTYTVTLNTNGGAIVSGNLTEYTAGTEVTLPTNIVNPGKTFLGWYETEDFSSDAVTTISADSTGDKTFYAKWKINPNKIAYSKVSGGMYHVLAIDESGNLFAWGLNNDGQLGNGEITDSLVAVQVMEGTTFKDIAAGNLNSYAIDESGNLYAWGVNGAGQLGDEATSNQTTPVQIKAGTLFTKVVAGASHALAIDESGNLYTWGYNNKGQLGSGTTDNANVPTIIMSGTTFKDITAGFESSAAITTDGKLYVWGANEDGQLGDGTTTDSSTPINIQSSTNFNKLAFSTGSNYFIAIDESGNIWGTGENTYGQLGDGSLESKQTLTQITTNTVFTDISIGYNHTLAIDENGNLYACGSNIDGELGDGTTEGKTELTKIKEGTKFTSVATTWNSSVAIDDKASLYTWGANDNGQLGDGTVTSSLEPKLISEKEELKFNVTFETNGGFINSGNITEYKYGEEATLPTDVINPGCVFEGWYETEDFSDTAVTKISAETIGDKTYYAKWNADYTKMGFVKVAAGGSHSLALDSKGNLWAWGDNSFGKLGDGTNTNSLIPLKIINEFKEISASSTHSLALTENGDLYAWGRNTDGQLGDGTTTSRNIPTKIMSGIKEISAGIGHSLAIDEDGNLYTWGANTYGQLGDGTTTSKNIPTKIMSGIKKISGNSNYSLAIDINGNLYAWGSNASGQLGDGTTTDKKNPTKIMSGIKEISTGNYHSLAIDEDGNLYTWGTNTYGQLGNGTTTSKYIPTKIMNGIKEISGGTYHSLALTEDGDLYLWGINNNGQIGNGGTGNATNNNLVIQTIPTKIMNETKFKEISAGSGHSLAIDEEGNLYAWGANSYGQVGDGTTTNSLIPVQLSTVEVYTFPLTLNTNGGTLVNGEITTYNYGETTVLPTAEEITKQGYTFAGWYETQEFTGEAVTQISNTKAGALEYFAKWEPRADIAYTVEHYKQNDALDGYTLEETESLTGTTGTEVIATAKTYDGYEVNTNVRGTVEKGTIAGDGSLVLKLYYDKVFETTFNIELNKKGEENGLNLEGAKYSFNLKYANAELEYGEYTTDSNGNIVITDALARNIMRVYYKEVQAPNGYVLDDTSKYVEIEVNTANELELTGSKTRGVSATVENNTLYIQETNYMENIENIIRINALDSTDKDIGLSNVSFELYYPDGKVKELVTGEDGITEVTGVTAPGVGTFLYEIVQKNTIDGYVEDLSSKYVNITFDASGIITNVEALSTDIEASKIVERDDVYKYEIANINILQERDSSSSESGTGAYSAYTIKIVEKDGDTSEVIQGVKYKITQESVKNSMTTTATAKKTTDENGETTVSALNGETLTIKLRRTAIQVGYKLIKGEETISLTKNASREYELTSSNDNVTIDNTNKTITINRTSIKTTSSQNTARSKSNMTFYITKVDELLRPLQGVELELREETTGTKWELTTDDNGLAKLSSEELVQTLGPEFPSYLNESEGKLAFWITEKSVPEGYESLNGNIGFEVYYEVTSEGTLEISNMNVLDGISYTHILDQEYNQYELDDYMQADIYMKVINNYSTSVQTVDLKTLQIEKVAEDNNSTKLKGASFQITLTYPTSGKLREVYTTNSNGLINVSKLYFPEGTTTIEIVEKVAPTGYVLNKVPTIIKVTNTSGVITVDGGTIADDGTIKVQIENTKKENEKTYSLVVEKRDANSSELIDYTADFKVTVTNGTVSNVKKIYTNEGKAVLNGLNGVGNIQIDIEETDAPAGYKLNSTVKTVYITKESLKGQVALDASKEQDTEDVRIVGNIIYVTVENEPNDVLPYVIIHKVDNENSKLTLRNAEFTVTMPDGNIRTVITNRYGNAIISLVSKLSGRYIIEETKAPSGYVAGKKMALDITFDEEGNISTANIVKDLGEEYTNTAVSFSKSNKQVYVAIGNSKIEYSSSVTYSSTYSIKIEKGSSLSSIYNLDGAKFDIDIEQENGINYSLTDTTEYGRGIIINKLSGTGNIKVTLQELKAPTGYIYDGTIREVTFTRNETTKKLALDEAGLSNIDASNIEIDNINHRVIIKIANEPRRYTPIIQEDGTVDTTVPPTGVTYNSVIIENEDINDHGIKIKGTTFKISKLGTYISRGITNEKGLTTISLGNEVYTTTVDYLIENYDMASSRYIKNSDVVLRITYNSDGTMQTAEITQGATTSEGKIAAEIDESFNYAGGHTLKLQIRCKRVGYTSIATQEPEVIIPSSPTGTTVTPEYKPEKKPSPITPIEYTPGESEVESEPDFGIALEKVNVYNNRIKVSGAKYAVYVTNEQTNETICKIATTDSSGKINIEGLLGFGNHIIKIIEINSPDGYALDEYKHTLTIYRDEESQIISIVEKDLAENATVRIDNINKIVNIKVEEKPSSISFAILKQDYDDEEIALKGATFKVTDVETNEIYEIVSGEEGMAYSTLPIKEDGEHSFTIEEISAPSGYNILGTTLTLKITYLNGLIQDAQVSGNDGYAFKTTQNTEYLELNILNKKQEDGVKYSVELIKADAYYSSITFENAKIKIDVENENGAQGITKTALTNADGKIYLNNIYGSGEVKINITEIEPPTGRRFDTKQKQVLLNVDQDTGWIKLAKATKNVDTFIDNNEHKIIIRIRNYPDNTFIIGANKVDSANSELMLVGAEYSIRLSGSSTSYTMKQHPNGVMALQNIEIPTADGTYEYIIKENTAPFGYALNTDETILSVTISTINGIKKITGAQVKSGSGSVESFGDEFIHLKLEDTKDNSIYDTQEAYNITLVKVDSKMKEATIKGALIGIEVNAESGESYYEELYTDDNGEINLTQIQGTGKIIVMIKELKAADSYLFTYPIRTIEFTRDPSTLDITIESVSSTDISAIEENGDVKITFENTIDNKNKYSLHLEKYIAEVNGTSREPVVNVEDRDNIKYEIDNTPIEITEDSTVIYNIRVYNVGTIDAYATTIVDKIPEGLEFVQSSSINTQYGWIYDDTTRVASTTYLSKATDENNVIGAFTEDKSTPEYKDLQIELKVLSGISDTSVENNAEVIPSEDGKDITGSLENELGSGETITVIREREVIVNKVWVDTAEQQAHRPANIKLQVKNGDTVVQEKTIANTETGATFTGLAKYDSNGNEITYTVAEVEVNENDLKYYTASVTGNMSTGYTITNTFTVPDETVDITVNKVWVDTAEQQAHRPANIKLQVKNGDTVVQEKTIANTETGATFTGLAKYDSNGNEITYTVAEVEVNTDDLKYYTASVTGNMSTGYTVTNTFTVPTDTVEVTVNKVWVDNDDSAGKRPASVIIVAKSGDIEKGQVELTVANALTSDTNTWQGKITNLPKYDSNGDEITYTIDEKEVNTDELKFYSKAVNQITRTVTNTFTVPTETVELTVNKVWVDNSDSAGKRPASVIIVAKSGDIEKGQVELTVANALTSDNNTWQGKITNLPKYDSNGDEITYTIDEKEVNTDDLKFYSKAIDQTTRTVTNTITVIDEKVDIIVEKEWVDNNNAEGKRPTSVIIVAKSGNTKVGQIELTSANALVYNNNIWRGKITNLPKYDSNGNEITYTVDEEESNPGDLKYYTKTIVGNRVINTLNIKKAQYRVEHYRRSLDVEVEGYNYEIEYFEGIIGETVTAIPKDYEGFVENTSHPNRIPSGVVLEDGTLVLRLYYDRETYYISYVLNGGKATGTLTKTYTYGREIYLSRKVEKAGYEFAGWYNSSNFDGDAITKIQKDETGNKVFYAKWIQKIVSSNNYSVDEVKEEISQVSPLTTVKDFLANLKINGNAKVYDLQGNEVSSDKLVGTGYTVKVEKDGETYEYQLAVKGDLDGDGKVSVTDLSIMNKAAVGKKNLEGVFKTAADLDTTDKISITDLSMMNQYIAGKIKF